jgi:hypothetical protein
MSPSGEACIWMIGIITVRPRPLTRNPTPSLLLRLIPITTFVPLPHRPHGLNLASHSASLSRYVIRLMSFRSSNSFVVLYSTVLLSIGPASVCKALSFKLLSSLLCSVSVKSGKLILSGTHSADSRSNMSSWPGTRTALVCSRAT